MFPAVFCCYTWRWRNLINSKMLCAVLANRIHKKLSPGRIYDFDPEPYKESVTQLQCYKALLVFPTIGTLVICHVICQHCHLTVDNFRISCTQVYFLALKSGNRILSVTLHKSVSS